MLTVRVRCGLRVAGYCSREGPWHPGESRDHKHTTWLHHGPPKHRRAHGSEGRGIWNGHGSTEMILTDEARRRRKSRWGVGYTSKGLPSPPPTSGRRRNRKESSLRTELRKYRKTGKVRWLGGAEETKPWAETFQGHSIMFWKQERASTTVRESSRSAWPVLILAALG